ncbi:alpha/beta fold hydrolase [Muricoccus radiodurans]|uniref:alpha/beta fold hydrolase n=1 Tax=Muricoccus radiodurans TaxID=2231721 RepID=UPI003CF8F141
MTTAHALRPTPRDDTRPGMADPGHILDALDRAAERWSTPIEDGGSLAWRGWGSGTPLVLLHGWAGSWRHWTRNIPALSARYRLLVPDLPGMGDSDALPAGATRGAVARIVIRGVHQILGPGGRYALSGFSFGGSVAGIAASLDGGRIDRVTLVAPGGFGIPSLAPQTARVRGLDGAERMAAHRHNLQALMFADPGRIDALALEIQDRNTARMRATFMAREPEALQEAVRRIAVPPRFIWGAKDNFCGARIGEYVDLVQQLRPADARIRLIEGAGHWVAYEAAEAFDAALLESLGA